MALINAQSVNSVRAIVTWSIRAASAAAVTLGLYLVLKRLLFGAFLRDFEAALVSHMEIGEGHSFYRGLSMVAVGVALGAASTRLAQWMIPVPARGCPGCGYAGPGRDGLCPECGLRIEDDQRPLD